MQVTNETRRTRWVGLIIIWVIAGAYLWLHSAAYRENLDLLDRVALRGAKVAPTPMRRLVPTMYADATMWVRNALALADGAGPQMRHTMADNAPYGREVHWSSGLAWLIAGEGAVRHAVTGEPLPQAIEDLLPWFNAPLIFAAVVLFSLWVSRRAGFGAGLFVGLAMIGNDDFYSGFAPNYVDHHGLLAAAVLGLMLGSVFMGVGFWRSHEDAAQLLPTSVRAARQGAVLSAICGAVGMWISAATLIPAIAIIGGAGAVAVLVHGRKAVERDVHLDAGVWRLWGRVGALLSFGFYLLEYAPAHLGFRLEVNHPVYAAGWWAGSEIIAQLAEGRCARVPFRWRRLTLAGAAIAVTPLIIAIGGARVFVVFDPFITRLSQHVAEGISLFVALKIFGVMHFVGAFVWTTAALALGCAAWWRCRPADRVVAGFCLLAVVAFTGMAVAQIRWAASASGPQICLVMVGLATLTARRTVGVQWVSVVLATLVLAVTPAVLRLTQEWANDRHHVVESSDAMQPVYRDIAAALRGSQPNGPIVLLASPNASVAIGYYGQMRTIGTLYWENLAGTKAAAEMFSAQSTDEARRLLRARGVTHIAMVSEDNFLAEYFGLLHPHPGKASLPRSFGYGLLVDLTVPMWLDPIPYAPPADLPRQPARVLLFKTHFGPPAAEAAYEAALDEFGAGHAEAAAARLDAAIALDPKSAEFWVAKANLLLARGQIQPAYAAAVKAVENADEFQRFTVCDGEASRFYQSHAHAMAAQFYEAAIKIRGEPATINNFAWLLATTPDNQVRSGLQALALCERLGPVEQLPFLNSRAAALAECGRFAEAVAVAGRAVESARKTGDASALAQAERRLAQYQAGKPWRE